MSEAKNFGAGQLPVGACRCFYLKHDLGTDLHMNIHERMRGDEKVNTKLICGGCGEEIAGSVTGATDTVSYVWIASRKAYFGEFRRLA